MTTVGSARALAARRLRLAGVESATLTADLLLGKVLGWERVRVLSRPETTLPVEAEMQFEELVQRRADGEPLQYLTGEQEFYGLLFRVSPAVLIPRPETEILVEAAISRAKRRPHPSRVADVGAGSGCIAVAVAHEVPAARVCALDVSLAALAVARENASRHGVLGRIEFLSCDLLGGLLPEPLFDFILSNPPYVARTEYNTLPAVVRKHEPHVALFAGESGLEVHQELVPQAAVRLRPGGCLMVEVGAGQAQAVAGMVDRAGLSVESVPCDLQGIPRCVIARKQTGGN